MLNLSCINNYLSLFSNIWLIDHHDCDYYESVKLYLWISLGVEKKSFVFNINDGNQSEWISETLLKCYCYRFGLKLELISFCCQFMFRNWINI